MSGFPLLVLYTAAEGEATEAEGGEETHAEEGHSEHHENNFFYGDINEVIWGSAAFAIVFAIFLWKGVPAIKRVMKKQQEALAARIAAGEEARSAAEAEVARVRSDLGNADAEAARIVAEARERAEVVKADLKRRAEEDVRDVVQRAHVEIEASKSQALADLREEITSMTVRATEGILEETLDDTAKSLLVDRYIDQVGASS